MAATLLRTGRGYNGPTQDGGAAPVRSGERVQELDVLRGVVLFAVFFLNMIDFAVDMSTDAQLAALPTAALDQVLYEIAYWLVDDKSITLFAFLFGLGFELQLRRMLARGADFRRLYLRRLSFLLGLGLVHRTFFWTWDILHVYALAGFALFALRDVGSRALLIGGALLTIAADPVFTLFLEYTGLGGWHGLPDPATDAVLLARQHLLVAGDYPAIVADFARYDWVDSLLRGTLFDMFFFALGRFMLGAWVGERGWFRDCRAYLPGFRRVLMLGLPVGLLGEGLARAIEIHSRGEALEWLGFGVHVTSLPVLAAGYAAAVVVAFATPLGRRLLAPFAHPGRMALTNYVSQSLLCGFVFSGVGPGLGLLGSIGVSAVIPIVIALYALQVLASRFWLERFRFGPLEWLWRGFTYGELPELRRPASPA